MVCGVVWQTDRETDRQRERQTDIQTDRETERQRLTLATSALTSSMSYRTMSPLGDGGSLQRMNTSSPVSDDRFTVLML